MKPLEQAVREAFLKAARRRGVPAGKSAEFWKTRGTGLRAAERRSSSIGGVATNRLFLSYRYAPFAMTASSSPIPVNDHCPAH